MTHSSLRELLIMDILFIYIYSTTVDEVFNNLEEVRVVNCLEVTVDWI